MLPVILPRSEHPISRRQIDPDALKVLYRLKQAGFIAYLVGGGVRDLLLGRRPKDFDISTSAHPNEVRKLFRNCRLIGRRFRLAHILFHAGKVIEVATFRRKSEEGAAGDDLLVRRENTFGSPEEDAERRDYTINGLFYDIATFSVIDYVGGLRDLQDRVIRTIGDPAVRLREDPVRMLRAVKFASRLGFEISPEDRDAIQRYRSDLLRAAPERLLLEVGRLVGGGHAQKAMRLLEEVGLMEVLLPEVMRYLERRRQDAARPPGEDVLWKDLAGLDRLVSGRPEGAARGELPLPVTLGVLLAPLLRESLGIDRPHAGLPVAHRGLGFALSVDAGPAGESDDARRPHPGESEEPDPDEPEIDRAEPEAPRARRPAVAAPAVTDLLEPAVARLSIPRRDTEGLLQVLAAQPRLARPGHRLVVQRTLARQSWFRDALMVFEAHVIGTLEGEAELRLWRRLADREPPVVDGPVPGRGRRGRQRDRRRPGGRGEDVVLSDALWERLGRRRTGRAAPAAEEAPEAGGPPPGDEPEAPGDLEPARRRRRRRGGRGRRREPTTP